MVKIKLDGGLGNQLFQYAFIKSLGRYFNVAFKVDISVYAELPNRASFELGKLNIPSDVFCSEVTLLRNINFLRLLRFLRIHRVGRIYIETNPVYKPLESYNPWGFYYGYFQFHSHFSSIAEELFLEFQYKEIHRSGFYGSVKQAESVGVHFRRGDYLSKGRTAKLMSDISEEYYTQSAKFICSKPKDNLVFFIFSNDVEWAKKNAKKIFQDFGEVVVVDHSGQKDAALLDFECLKQCNHQIIANSTFSWWAAYLNRNPNKKVCAPLRWYKRFPMNKENFYPTNWKVIESTNE